MLNKLIKWTPFPKPPIHNPSYYEKQDAVSLNISNNNCFPGHYKAITAIDYHPKKAIIATCSDDRTWKLWKSPKMELLQHGEGHKEWISDINFHPDGILMATCGGDSTIKIWGILKLKCILLIYNRNIMDCLSPLI